MKLKLALIPQFQKLRWLRQSNLHHSLFKTSGISWIQHPDLKIYYLGSRFGEFSPWALPQGYLTYDGIKRGLDNFYGEWERKAELEGGIGILFRKFAFLSTISPPNVNGTEVVLHFSNNASFYYPGGALGSYKYAIPSKMYMIRVPLELAITMEEGEIERVITYKRWRYYIVREGSDILGFIRRAIMLEFLWDRLRKLSEWIFDRSSIIAWLCSFVLVIASFAVAMMRAEVSRGLAILYGIGMGIVAPLISAPLALVGFLVIKAERRFVLPSLLWLGFVVLLGIIF
jgi:multidrug transporter EmrE-like cation transporter